MSRLNLIIKKMDLLEILFDGDDIMSENLSAISGSDGSILDAEDPDTNVNLIICTGCNSADTLCS